MTLTCPAGKTIHSIDFASYGTPVGSCGGFSASSCNASTSISVVINHCIGQATCSIYADNSVFGDPCPGTAKLLDVQATCQ
jgi:hypothetical protein